MIGGIYQPGPPRLAVDIGGTFTDVAVQAGSRYATAKVFTTLESPAEGALEGITIALARASVPATSIVTVIHGTTLATNSLIERDGARVGLVLTRGFRDVLEIGNERRYDQYDLLLEKSPALVPRDRCYTVDERIGAAGEVIRPLDRQSVTGMIEEIRAAGVESVAVGLLHSYANGDHEHSVASELARALPDIPVSLSSEVSPEVREYDRVSTTVADAYIKPRIAGYLREFERALRGAGLDCPLLMMTSSGGMVTLDTAARVPIRLVESGPSGGAILASRIAADAGLSRVVSFDMGGTTAKFGVIDDATPLRARAFEVGRAARFIRGSGFPIRVPVIELIEIGAGGGSIASVDALGRLIVGPHSAGARPGPACYDRGGSQPTVTDADALLGMIDPEKFADGRLTLSLARAREAIEGRLASPLEMTIEGAADGVLQIVDENMANAARIHSAERGTGLEKRTLVAFGGNGPLHASRIADKLRIDRIVVPLNPGVGSAVGFLVAPVSYEIVRSHYVLLRASRRPCAYTAAAYDSDVLAPLNAVLAAMQTEAEGVVRQAAPDEPLKSTRTAFMRYRGQGHEVEVPMPARPLAASDVEQLQDAYAQRYAALYGRAIGDMDAEVLNWSVVVSTTTARALPVPMLDECAGAADGAAPTGDGAIVGGSPLRSYSRDRLSSDQVVDGPALIAETSTTIYVGEEFTATVDAAGNVIMNRRCSGT